MPPSIRLYHTDLQAPDVLAAGALATSGTGQEAPESISGVCVPQTVSVRLGDLLPILVRAVQDRRAWVADFYDDTVDIPQDLYEVVLAFQHHAGSTCRRAA